jgi:hypothetical protein
MLHAAWKTFQWVAPTKPMPLSPTFSNAGPLTRPQPPAARTLATPPRNVAEQLYRVELTASFLERLDSIAVFLTEAEAAFAFAGLWPPA